MQKTTGKTPPELDVEPIPEELNYLLYMFYELSATRPVGMSVGPIAFSEILAYNQLHNVGIVPWEVEAIKRLDIVWLRVRNG